MDGADDSHSTDQSSDSDIQQPGPDKEEPGVCGSTKTSLDGILLSATENAFDSENHPASQIIYDAEGKVSFTASYTYTDGLNTSTEIDRDGDGAIDRRVTNEFDEQGRMTTAVTDDGPDGTTDMRVEYEYEPNKEIIKVFLYPPNLYLVAIRTRFLDEQTGRPLKAVDEDMSGAITQVQQWYYDDPNYRVVLEINVNDDESIDERAQYQLDPYQNDLETRWDEDGDGQWDWIETYDYSCWD